MSYSKEDLDDMSMNSYPGCKPARPHKSSDPCGWGPPPQRSGIGGGGGDDEDESPPLVRKHKRRDDEDEKMHVVLAFVLLAGEKPREPPV
jgi:hypothetical protein